MIVHARLLGFTAKRVGYKAKPEPVAKAAPAKKAVAVKVPAPAGKAATPAAPAKAVAKKARVKKVAATNVPAVKAPTPKAPAKKAVAKKATPQQAAAKKVAPKPPANNVSTPAKAKPVSVAPAVAPSPEAKTLARIQKGLLKMGNQAPQIDLVTTSALENPAVIAVVNESRRAVYESAHKSGDEVRDKLADLNLKVADVADAVVWARISHERSV